MNTTSIHHRLGAILSLALCVGCSQPPEEQPSATCGQGVEVQLETQSVCA